jgi:hypothetical protein
MDDVVSKFGLYRLLAILASLIALSGCAPIPSVDLSRPAAVHEATKLSVDPYSGDRVLVGPTVDRVHQNKVLYVLASSEKFDTIFLEYYTPERGFLESAVDIEGRNLDMSAGLYTTTDPSEAAEIAFLILPPGYLQEHIGRGIHLRAYGEGRSIDLSVSPSYIQGYLQKKKQISWPTSKELEHEFTNSKKASS